MFTAVHSAIRQVISMAHNDPSGFRAALDISAAYWWLLDNPGQVIVFVGGLMTAPLLLPLIAQLKVVLPKQVVLVRGQEKVSHGGRSLRGRQYYACVNLYSGVPRLPSCML